MTETAALDFAKQRSIGRNTTMGTYRTLDVGSIIPDQTRHSLYLKDMLELRTLQN